jgi:SAM-dependent methyltransferase
MPDSVLDHLLRTLAAARPGQRVLLRASSGDDSGDDSAEDSGRVVRPLARLGFEVHAATWTDDAARRVQEAVTRRREPPAQATGAETAHERASLSGESRAGPVYATAAPLGTLPYPEGHFGWSVVQGPVGGGPAARSASLGEAWQALLEEARHHLRPGGWVFVMDEPADGEALTPDVLDRAAEQAQLAEAEAPQQQAGDGGALHAIYRRVEADTPL